MSALVTTKSDDLARLAARINEEHEAAQQSYRNTLAHAQVAGQLLIDAKSKCAFGGWIPWIGENCPFGRKHASNYMRLARDWPRLGQRVSQMTDVSLRKAITLMSAPKPTPVVNTTAREIAAKTEPRPSAPPPVAPAIVRPIAHLRREPTAEEIAESKARDEIASRLLKTVQAWCREHPGTPPELICEALGDVLNRIQDGAEEVGQ